MRREVFYIDSSCRWAQLMIPSHLMYLSIPIMYSSENSWWAQEERNLPNCSANVFLKRLKRGGQENLRTSQGNSCAIHTMSLLQEILQGLKKQRNAKCRRERREEKSNFLQGIISVNNTTKFLYLHRPPLSFMQWGTHRFNRWAYLQCPK